MIPKEFDAIAKEDIDSLVNNAVSEARTIEYKEQLPGGTDDDKREFLADVSSFANAGGGDLIYGVPDKRDADGKPTGIPEPPTGVLSTNVDADKRRLEDMLRSGIQPRIPGVRLKHIDGFATRPVLVLRVPKSWASPHMVTFKNLSRFFSRTSAGRHQLDVQEIRAAFNASEALAGRIEDFRSERLGRIIADETPVSLPPDARAIIHLIPFTFSNPSSQVDLSPLWRAPHKFTELRRYDLSDRINFDGFLRFTPQRSYLQIFRSGVFETVVTGFVQQHQGRKLIDSTSFEINMLDRIENSLYATKELGIPLPLLLLVTLQGVKGCSLSINSSRLEAATFDVRPIDREILLLSQVFIENYPERTGRLLKPIFDAIWQSVGWPGCGHYDAQGDWDGACGVKR
ncbi:MAG TPA: ATP-binding protein [Verrucomicrobiae bacterium]|jgi:hypothetical protein|nr:ATP-binding protein [Verrucomicrobiae bacterium]